MASRVQLDSTDWAILRELQADGNITNVELARRVGLSAPPCLRRVRALEESGVVKGYRALLDPAKLGYDVICFGFVQLGSQAEADLEEFQNRMKAWDAVRECWKLTGEIDFIIKSILPDLAGFQSFVGELTAMPHVKNVRTALALEQIKDAAVRLPE